MPTETNSHLKPMPSCDRFPLSADSHLGPIPTSNGTAITFGSVCVAALQRFLIFVFGPFGSNAEKYFFDKFGNDVTTFRPAPQLRGYSHEYSENSNGGTLSTQMGVL